MSHLPARRAFLNDARAHLSHLFPSKECSQRKEFASISHRTRQTSKHEASPSPDVTDVAGDDQSDDRSKRTRKPRQRFSVQSAGKHRRERSGSWKHTGQTKCELGFHSLRAFRNFGILVVKLIRWNHRSAGDRLNHALQRNGDKLAQHLYHVRGNESDRSGLPDKRQLRRMDVQADDDECY